MAVGQRLHSGVNRPDINTSVAVTPDRCVAGTWRHMLRVFDIVTHDGVALGAVTASESCSYARLRKAVVELDVLNWCPPTRPGGMVLDVPLDFDFLVESPNNDEPVEEDGEPRKAGLSLDSEPRTVVVPDALGRVYIRFHDVIHSDDGGMRMTRTLSPLGPVGTIKSASSADLLAAVEKTKSDRPHQDSDTATILEHMSLTFLDDESAMGPHLSPGSRLESPQSPLPLRFRCCPGCVYSRYRRLWLYKDPRSKRRVCYGGSALLVAFLAGLYILSASPELAPAKWAPPSGLPSLCMMDSVLS